MHELAISQSVVDAVLARTGDARVTVVRLDVGRLSGVVPDALRFCFDLVADGTPLAGAELRIAEPPGRARCATCGADFGLEYLVVRGRRGGSAITAAAVNAIASSAE